MLTLVMIRSTVMMMMTVMMITVMTMTVMMMNREAVGQRPLKGPACCHCWQEHPAFAAIQCPHLGHPCHRHSLFIYHDHHHNYSNKKFNKPKLDALDSILGFFETWNLEFDLWMQRKPSWNPASIGTNLYWSTKEILNESTMYKIKFICFQMSPRLQ